MVPTLLVGDYLFVSKFSYGYSRYSLPLGLPLFCRAGSFSTSRSAATSSCSSCRAIHSTDFIKRIVGLPGDKIQMKDGVLNINGQPIKRDRIGTYFYYRKRRHLDLHRVRRDAAQRLPARHHRKSATTGHSTTPRSLHRARRVTIS